MDFKVFKVASGGRGRHTNFEHVELGRGSTHFKVFKVAEMSVESLRLRGLHLQGEGGGVKGEAPLMKCRLLRISGRLLRVPLVLRLLPSGGLADGAPPHRCGCRVLRGQGELHRAMRLLRSAPPGFTVIEV